MDEFKMTKQGVRDLNSFGRPVDTLGQRRAAEALEQKLCEHFFECRGYQDVCPGCGLTDDCSHAERKVGDGQEEPRPRRRPIDQ